MKLKSFFLACLLALSFFIAGLFCTTIHASQTTSEAISNRSDYTYVRVDVDGVPWIFVYDDKGNLIMTYPEE
ncbi:MAG: hypothetical protein JST55_10680 [Bacteroidetes bacterium]|nr:hypothetical protein [Bacteroidota bacterium]